MGKSKLVTVLYEIEDNRKRKSGRPNSNWIAHKITTHSKEEFTFNKKISVIKFIADDKKKTKETQVRHLKN